MIDNILIQFLTTSKIYRKATQTSKNKRLFPCNAAPSAASQEIAVATRSSTTAESIRASQA